MDSKDFREKEWEEISRIDRILQNIRESKSKSNISIEDAVNKILNSFVLFLLRKNFFKLTPQYGIDEYGIPVGPDYGDDPICFAPMDGKNIFFRYWPLVEDIETSLDQQGEKKFKMTFDFLLNQKEIEKKSIRV